MYYYGSNSKDVGLSAVESAEIARVEISPSVLRAARSRVHLTEAEAESKIGRILVSEAERDLDPGSVKSWEQGLLEPSIEEAEAAALVYLIPFSALMAGQLPSRPIIDYRLSAGTTGSRLSYTTLKSLAQFDAMYALAERVSRVLAIDEAAVTVPRADVSGPPSLEEVERLGVVARGAIGIDDDGQLQWPSQAAALEAVQSGIEASGVFVFRQRMELNECRGAARWDAGGPPSILVNASDSATAQLFTLLHEFTHLMTSRFSDGSIICDPAKDDSDQNSLEAWANRVAAAALVPQTLLDLALPSRTPDGPYQDWPGAFKTKLQHVFRVSNEVIGIRLYHLRRAGRPPWTPRFWRVPREEPHGRRLAAAAEIRRSLGGRACELSLRAIRSEKVSEAELARRLSKKPEDLGVALGLT